MKIIYGVEIFFIAILLYLYREKEILKEKYEMMNE